MANQWYFARDGATSGPFSAVQLRALATAGQLRPEDTVWKEGMARRVVAAKVDKLFAAGPAAARPSSAELATLTGDTSPPPGPAAARPSTLAEWLAGGKDLELAPGTEVWEETAPAAPGRPPAEEPPAAEKPRLPQPQARNLRVLGVKGAILTSQDGKVVKFRKKCLRCGYADTSLTTMPIRSGVTRVNFFCPKCRKSRAVEIQGVG